MTSGVSLEEQPTRLELLRLRLQFNHSVRLLEWELEAKTNANGEFQFLRVLPFVSSVQVGPQVIQGNTRSVTYTKEVAVSPGQISHVQIGGEGRPVTGKLCREKQATDVEDRGSSIQLVPVDPVPPGFVRYQDPPTTATNEAWTAWTKTREYKEYSARRRVYSVALNSDGSFRVEDVIEGKYLLQFNDGKKTYVVGKFEVPAMPEGYSEQPLDIGAFPDRQLSIDYVRKLLQPDFR
ncbi:MAG: hypothetical protein ACR2IE_09965 [Candidatus Sumerlaeaceae bacterium]